MAKGGNILVRPVGFYPFIRTLPVDGCLYGRTEEGLKYLWWPHHKGVTDLSNPLVMWPPQKLEVCNRNKWRHNVDVWERQC